MCMEDERIGRALAVQATTTLLPFNTLTEVLPADPARVRIVFSGPGDNIVWVGPEGVTPAANRGFALTLEVPQMTIDVKVWGRLVTGRWVALCRTTDSNLGIMVATLEKQ